MTTIKTVGVLGAGLMGSGIAQVCAQSRTHDQGARGVRRPVPARQSEHREELRPRHREEQRQGHRSRPRCGAWHGSRSPPSLRDLADCDIVIEAVVEDLEVKNALWKELDGVCPPHTIFASNTSSLTIAAMAAAHGAADRMVGLHFFNPVPLMKLVEVVRTITTSDETVRRAPSRSRSRSARSRSRAKDNSGLRRQPAARAVHARRDQRARARRRAASKTSTKAMQLGAGYPMGPFTLLDFVGLDTTYKIAEIMFDEYREKRYAPPPLLKRMVMAGMYGQKSGKGFYDYSRRPADASTTLGL